MVQKKVYGYIRVSTRHQKLGRQRENIKKVYPLADIYEEVYTGTRVEGRYQLNRLLKKVRSGDTIVFDSVSRMSRNAAEGIDLYFKLLNDGVNLEFLKEPYINTSVYMDKLANNKNIEVEDSTLNDTIMAGVRNYLEELAKAQIRIAFEQSEKEVNDLRQRIREGIFQAKAKREEDIKAGRIKVEEKPKKVIVTEKEKIARKLIEKYNKEFGGKLNDKDTLAIINGKYKDFSISKGTYYNYKQKMLYERYKKEEMALYKDLGIPYRGDDTSKWLVL